MADNTCKYYKLVKQVSYNSGQTWSNVDPPQYQQGDLYESGSTDCPSGDTGSTACTTTYRWVNSGETCSGTSLYSQQIKEVSYDCGVTWGTVTPIETKYNLVNSCSPLCGGEPRYTFYYNNGSIFSDCCDASVTDAFINYGMVHEEIHASSYKIMTAATIGQCVKTIEHEAFINCKELENVTMTDNVEFIYELAFNSCYDLTSITLSDNITEIWWRAFTACLSLKNITLPSKLKWIDNECFMSCRNLSSISVPPLVYSIGAGAFVGCTSLSSVTFQSNENLLYVGGFSGCTSLSSITLPDSVVSIGNRDFASCINLGTIIFGCNLQSIGYHCFEGIGGSNNLSSVNIYFKSIIPPNYNSWGGSDNRLIGAFPRNIDGPVLNVYVPNEALDAYSYHFPSSGFECNLYGYNPTPCDYYYNPPSGVDYKFYGVFEVGWDTPDEEGIPRPYKLIEADGNTTLSFEETTFDNGSHIKKIFVGEGVTNATINNNYNSTLTEIEFPSTISSIGGAYSNSSINRVTIKALTPPIVSKNTFGSNAEYPIYVPNSVLDDYKSSIYWTYQTNYENRLVGY